MPRVDGINQSVLKKALSNLRNSRGQKKIRILGDTLSGKREHETVNKEPGLRKNKSGKGFGRCGCSRCTELLLNSEFCN